MINIDKWIKNNRHDCLNLYVIFVKYFQKYYNDDIHWNDYNLYCKFEKLLYKKSS